MRSTFIRITTRASACLLLLQPITTLFAVGNALNPKNAVKASSVKYVSPTKMTGVPTMKAQPPSTPAPLVASPKTKRDARGTLLNDVGRLREPISSTQEKAWRTELNAPKTSPERKRWLAIWLGEIEMGRQEPDKGMALMHRAWKSTPETDEAYGLAKFNHAIARFYAGMYADAHEEFQHAIRSKWHGFDRRAAAMWLKRASACAGYHEDNERLGIVQPERLDPLCGVSGVAMCLRAFNMPYGKAEVKAIVPHTGEGSTMADLMTGFERAGLKSYPVTATEKGLKALPKPVIAHVERDHFVTITRTSDKYVWYVCSDCGPWPGGEQRITWMQYRAMYPGLYLAVTKPGTPEDSAFAQIARTATKPDKNAVAVRWHAPLQGDAGRVAAAARQLLSALSGQVQSYVAIPATVWCGEKPDSLHCANDCLQGACPTDGPAMISNAGPSYGDPVNLATGEEEYTPGPDIVVYNPLGPSVFWGRLYNSLSNYHSSFGIGWSHTYNVGIEETLSPQTPGDPGDPKDPPGTGGDTGGGGITDPPSDQPFSPEPQGPGTTPGTGPGGGPVTPPTSMTRKVVLRNGAKISFTAPTTVSATNTNVLCTVAAGIPIRVNWKWDSGTSTDYFEVTFKDRTKWRTGAATTGVPFRPIKRLYDKVGNWIGFDYTNYNFTTYPPAGGSTAAWPRLTRIYDSANTTLLSMGLDTNGWIVSASDRYNRSVYYTVGTYNSANVPWGWRQAFPLVNQVSQIVTTGTSTPPIRYQYGYQNNLFNHGTEMVPFLKTITVPSPTGTGTQTSTINYDNNGFVSSLVDANGNRREYGPTQIPDPMAPGGFITDPNQTTVTVKNPAGTVVYKRSVGFNAGMNAGSEKNASDQSTMSASFSDPNAPQRPSSRTMEGRTWSFTYDAFGNPLTATSPKGIVTTYTYDYTNNPLGEVVQTKIGTRIVSEVEYFATTGLIKTVREVKPGEVGTNVLVSKTYTYTTLGNLSTLTLPGNNAGSTRTYTFGYTTDGGYTQPERLGQVITISEPSGNTRHFRYDTRGNISSQADALGNETLFTYNIADQMTQGSCEETNQTGTGRSYIVNAYLYPGGPMTSESIYDESGVLSKQAISTYGKEGELLGKSGNIETISLTYTPLYQVATVKDGLNQTTSYTYDLVGRVTQYAYPGSTGASYDKIRFTSYNATGQILQRTDGNGVVTNYVYGDADGLLTAIQYPATPSRNVSFTYDNFGRNTAATDATGSSSFTFDDAGRVLTATRTYTGLSPVTFTYAYYPDGTRQSLTTPSGTLGYSYDVNGRWASMTSPAGTTSATFLNNGWQSGRTLPNGVATTYGYNAMGQMTGVTNTGSSGAISSYTNLAYDGAGRLNGFTASVTGVAAHTGATTYGYDSVNRLTQETSARNGGYSFTNAYDAAGNPTTLAGTTRTYNSNNQRSGTGFVYDGNGNPTTYGGTATTFDPESRLTSYGTDWTADYRYDGLRAWKTVGGVKVYFLYDQGRPILEMNASGTATAFNVHAPDGLVARGLGSTWTYYTFDHQGNVAQRLNSSQTVLNASIYNAYGQESSTSASTDPFGYNAKQGYYYDREIGMYLCQYRYYDPNNARWLNRDPVRFAGGVNIYAYCGGNPIMQADPSGTNIWIDLLKACGMSVIGMIGDILGGGGGNSDANICKGLSGCIAGLIGAGITAALGGTPFGICAGGALSSLLSTLAEDICDSFFPDPEDPCWEELPQDPVCRAADAIIGAISGCIGGFIDSKDSPWVTGIINGVREAMYGFISGKMGIQCSPQRFVAPPDFIGLPPNVC